ncbi:MAG: nicotinate phosphoribosyltransferase [Clostridia bacterium]|nr:nicotinate phosphoribosyltransferase [Clostridia bacterium]
MTDTKRQNFTMLCDYYELTMANGYFKAGMANRISYFDVFFRDIPDGGGFAIAAGLEQFIDYIKNLHFSEEDIAYLRAKNTFDTAFLESLKNFRFTGDIYAIPEGTPIFPHEPIVTVRAPAAQAQFIETFLLLSINHQSLIATKANRIVRAAKGRAVAEFGSRRAQGADGAYLGARAAYIGGCAATACTITDRDFGVPATGTMAHSWVQMFDSEYEAFKTYCQLYPNNATLLVDTYNTLKSGVPNAIRAFKEVLLPRGIRNFGIRLDSGDIAYLTKKARAMLDEAGLPECKIVVSNSLDEDIILALIRQGACVDSFGVGERMITSKSTPVFGGVYKLCAIEKDGQIIPKIKISENAAKITNPHYKKVYRLYENATGKAVADYITLHDEVIDETKPLELFDPDFPWKRKTLTDFTARELQVPIFKDGKCVYTSPSTSEIRDYCASQIDTLWDEVKRFENPHNYYVDLSQKLWNIKQDLLKAGNKKDF